MDVGELRNLIADYLDFVRAFKQRVFLIESRIFAMPNATEAFTHPEAVLKQENDFVNQLVHLLNELNRAMRHSVQWRIHLDNLARNLYLSPQEMMALFGRKKKAIHLMAAKDVKARITAQTDGLGYLRWIAVDTAEELERLLVEMRALDLASEDILNLFQKYQSPELTRWKRVLSAWLDLDVSSLVLALQGFLDEASLKTFDEAIHALASYIDVVVNLLAHFSTLSKDFDFLSLEWMSKILAQFDQLTKAGVQLHELLSQRTKMGLLYGDHELAIIQAILPSDIVVDEWFVMYATNPTKSTHELLPTDIRIDALPFALRQAEAAILSMESLVQVGEHLLESVQILPQILKSPIVGKFLEVDGERLALFRSARSELLRRLRQLQEKATLLGAKQ